MKKIITYWTYDLLHEWHMGLLKEAKSMWDYLIVWISTDSFNKLKWKESFLTYKQRKLIVENLKYVDQVIPEENWEQKELDIKNMDVDIFVMWEDRKWKFDFLETICEVKYLNLKKYNKEPNKKLSSTDIRSDILSRMFSNLSILISNNDKMYNNLIMRLNSIFLIPMFFIFSYVIPKKRWLYLFGSMNWKNFSWNSKNMFKFYQKNKTSGLSLRYMTKNKNLLLDTNYLNINSFKWLRSVLRAELLFTDSSASSLVPFLALLWNFKIIRLRHWDALKKINFDSSILLKNIWRFWTFLLKNEYKNNLLIPTSNNISKNNMNTSFLTNKSLVTWLPRNDVFFDKNFRDLKSLYDILGSEYSYDKIYLYAPTFRDTNSNIVPFSFKTLGELNDYLRKENILMLISSHIQTESISFNESTNIKQLNLWNYDFQDVLSHIDLLITDYSSSYIDFLLTDKPIIFYAYDLNNYLSKDREMYFNYRDVIIKETLITSELDFLPALQNINQLLAKKSYIESYKKLKKFFHKYQNWWYSNMVDNFIKHNK